MANILIENVSVVPASAAALRVRHTQVHDDGIDMGGELVLERSAAAWLAAEVTKAVDAYSYPETDAVLGPDHFTVYVGGSDMQPFVHVHNQRDASAVEGKVYTLGLSVDTARALAAQLAEA